MRILDSALESKIKNVKGNKMESRLRLSERYDERRGIKIVCEYKNGKRNGFEKYYDENGKLESECEYKNDEINGIMKGYYENGKLESECEYKNNKQNGIEKRYNESGKLRYECEYKNDKRIGIGKCYHENGELESVFEYKNGRKIGVERQYYENGALQSECEYKNGKKNGSCRYYNENGDVILDMRFDNGLLISAKGIKQYRNGRKEYDIDNGSGELRGFDKDSKLVYKKVYQNHKLMYATSECSDVKYEVKDGNGKITRFCDGIISYEEIYKNGYIVEKIYYRDGNLQARDYYDNAIDDPFNPN